MYANGHILILCQPVAAFINLLARTLSLAKEGVKPTWLPNKSKKVRIGHFGNIFPPKWLDFALGYQPAVPTPEGRDSKFEKFSSLLLLVKMMY